MVLAGQGLRSGCDGRGQHGAFGQQRGGGLAGRDLERPLERDGLQRLRGDVVDETLYS